jgi:hypothetical protein
VLAARAPSLTSALLAAKAAGYGHVIIDGTLIAITAPYGWPLWTSKVRPGREHDVCGRRSPPPTRHSRPSGLRHRLGV